MAQRRNRHCWNCGASREDVGDLSWSGLCPACGRERLVENIDGIHNKAGVAYARQQIGQVRAAIRDPAAVNALIAAGYFDYIEGAAA